MVGNALVEIFLASWDCDSFFGGESDARIPLGDGVAEGVDDVEEFELYT